MKSLQLALVLSCLSVLSPMAVSAHEGHGHTEGHSLLHYLSEPIHLAGVLTLVLAVVLLFRWRSVRVREKTGKDA